MLVSRSVWGALVAGSLVLASAGIAVAQEPSSGPALEATQWSLRQLAVEGSVSDVPSDVSATLYLADGDASGDAGCNTFTGSYTLDGQSLSFGPIMSTLMICGGVQDSTEAAYLAAFPLVASYVIDGEALSLLDTSGALVVAYEAAAAQPIVDSWVVTSYNTKRNQMEPPIAGSTLTAVFGPDGTVEGNAGCNHFFGPYAIDGDGMAIGPLATTLVACGSGDLQDQEAQYLALLAASDKWSVAAGVLELVDTGGVGRQTTVAFSVASGAAFVGSWLVKEYDNGTGGIVTPVEGSALTVVFDADGDIEGNAGCNTFSGPYSAVGSSMTVGPLATTRMACSSPALDTQEQQLLTALQGVATWEADDDTITLRGQDGSTKVVLGAASSD